jgi:peptidoglycan/LPS O-acetylase OafA/YrhL
LTILSYLQNVFLYGIICAILDAHKIGFSFLNGKFGAIAFVISIIGLCAAYSMQDELLTSLFMMAVFYIIVCGQTFFGLFRSKGLLLMGSVSYSTYLLHGFALFAFGVLLKMVVPEIYNHIFIYWSAIGIFSLCVVVISTLSFLKVEQPFFHKK